jgi:two-component system phosphate regulon sensor histidine kinase PhoR
LYHRYVARNPKSIPRNLILAFGAALLVPCGIVIFFGTRAVQVESRFAQSLREDRLRSHADPISRHVDRVMKSLRDRTRDELWPFRENAWEAEAAEERVRALVLGEPLISCGVLFDGDGKIHGPALATPFRQGEDLEVGPEAEVDVFSAGVIAMKLRRMTLRHRIESAVALKGSAPISALTQLESVMREAEDDGIRALALVHIARIRLELGDARDAILRSEDFISRDLSGPLEEKLPLRGLMYLLRAKAWFREGSPGRALEVLFQFWDELLEPGRYDLDLEGFDLVEARIVEAAERYLAGSGQDPERWRERIRKRREAGQRARARAQERRLLREEILPRVLSKNESGEGPRYHSLHLEDRLEVFLYIPPAAFEEGLAAGDRRGAGFRVDPSSMLRGELLPLVAGVSADEARVGFLDQHGISLGPAELGEGPRAWPLPEPFHAWRVAVTPGEADPEGRYVRNQMVFHAFLVAWAILAVFGAGFLMMRSWRRATELANLRSEFVSMVTHDLKTPLTSIRMFTETLRMGRLKDPVRVGEYYGFIANEVERLERLIDNILEFARIEAGRKAYARGVLDLNALVGDVLHGFRPSAEANGFSVEAALEPMESILGDEEALQRALWNLLSNALKFSGEEKWVGVRLRTEGGTAVIEVADRGVGIPPGDLPRVFEKFYRSSTEGGGSRSGTGLGLALVRHTARGHNGDVFVSSDPGKGTTFRLCLPFPESEETGGAPPA